MKKRIVSMLLCIAIILCGILPTTALAVSNRDTSYEESVALKLKELGLFQGVSETNFDLNRQPTRVEALVMLIRVLGKEKEALSGTYQYPFTDVPDWASKYVGYAYKNGLTNGVSSTKFGTGNANAQMYLTFVLRSLGYSDTNNSDFSWSDPYTLAKSVGIIPTGTNVSNFWRADIALISYAALSATLKNSSQTLADKLISMNAFSAEKYAAVIAETTSSAMTAEQIYAAASPAVFYIAVYSQNGTMTASGSGFFIDSNGTAVTNYHVIEGCSSAKITVSDTNKQYDVTGVCAYNATQDWAIIKVNGSGFQYLTIDTSSVVGGQKVYAIGSPLGLQNTISEGIVSNPSREEDGINYIQTSAAISSGSSGGALLNASGKVIGITSASYTAGQNLNLAIPMSYVDTTKASSTPKSFSSIFATSGSATSSDSSSSDLTLYGYIKYISTKLGSYSSQYSEYIYKYDTQYSSDGSTRKDFSLCYDPNKDFSAIEVLVHYYGKSTAITELNDVYFFNNGTIWTGVTYKDTTSSNSTSVDAVITPSQIYFSGNENISAGYEIFNTSGNMSMISYVMPTLYALTKIALLDFSDHFLNGTDYTLRDFGFSNYGG